MTSFAEYLALERESEIKHEFDSGEILAMSGGTARHSALAVNISFALRGAIEYDPQDVDRTTIINPVLLVEVLSDDTEKADRGNKWMHYQRIPSLIEYVLVSQNPRIEVYRRMPAGTWEYFEVREGTVKLACGPTLDLSTLYADLPV